MKLMIDTNVLLDVLLDRKPYADDSAMIWRLCEAEETEGCISYLSFANMVYVLRKKINKESIMHMITDLSLIFKFEALEQGDLYTAAGCLWDDFEDAIQFATAVRINADYIITRNKKDYQGSTVPVMTPKEFLASYKEITCNKYDKTV